MRRYRVDIYEFCSPIIRDAIESFCKTINQSKADVFLIMAHKAVQLFFILLEQGHIDRKILDKIVITNPALDFNCTYLSGKKIAIIDDIVISGTSISSTANKLLKLQVPEEDIEVITIAIDLKYFAMNFDRTDGENALHCQRELPDDICIDLSSTVSKIFSHYGVPYDVDFPTYESIPIEAKNLNLLHDNIFWDVMDVTNSNQAAGHVCSYTLYPHQCVKDKLWSLLGINLEKTVHLKIRMYIKRFTDGSLNCSVVPMCLFNEIAELNLDELYDFIISKSTCITLNQDNLLIAQMRHLQFYIAHQLYVVFSEIMSVEQQTVPHRDILYQLFGYIDGETIYNSINIPHCPKTDVCFPRNNDVDSDGQKLVKAYLKHNTGRKTLEEIKELAKQVGFENECWVNKAIFAPFLWWYQTKEIPVRNILYRKSLHYIWNYKTIESYLARLNSGFTLSTLKSILHRSLKEIPDAEAEIVISSLIDRAIDEGIIVPTIYHNKNKKYLCRAYRHGEDLPFGPTDECRLLYFLKYLGEKIPSLLVDKNGVPVSGISEITMEKIIVLFYQMGLKRGGIFNRFLGFGSMKILHPFLSLHGKVQGITDSDVETHMYSERNSIGIEYIMWLTLWLKNEKIIKWVYDPSDKQEDRQKKKKLYSIDPDEIKKYLRKNERSSITDSIKRNIKSIAGMIATWYEVKVSTDGKDAFKNDITALTSCVDGYVFCAAIGTEIHYFSKFWANQAKAAFDYAVNSEQLINWLSEPPDEKAPKYIADMEQGLNSGRDKIEWFNNRNAVRVITEVEMMLQNETANVWAGFWDSAKTNLSAPNRGMTDKHRALATWAVGNLYFFSACFDCLRNKNFWDNTGLPAKYEIYKNKYKILCKQTGWLRSDLFSVLDTIARIPKSDFNTKVEQFNKLVNDMLAGSKRYISMIETALKDEIPNYTIWYKSALIVDIHPLDKAKINDKFMDLWLSYDEDLSKTELNIVQFPQDFCMPPYVRYGIFYGTNKGFRPPDAYEDLDWQDKKTPEDMLFDVFERLCNLFRYNSYSIRGIMLPHLEPAQSFTHNLQKNIPENVKEFCELVVFPLEPYYIGGKKFQIILGVGNNTAPQFNEKFKSWNDEKKYTKIRNVAWLDQCTVYYDNCFSLSENKLDQRIMFSLVTIKCGNDEGLGFLLRTHDKVVCISCNHIVRQYLNGEKIMATSVHNTEVSFPLEPIKHIKYFDYDNGEIAPVEDEVAILCPCWPKHTHFAFSALLYIEDFVLELDEYTTQACSFTGGIDAEGILWKSDLKLEKAIPKGYYQISGTDGKIQAGFSGGIYITDEPHPSILGIHEGRNEGDDISRMIPWKIIRNAVERV